MIQKRILIGTVLIAVLVGILPAMSMAAPDPAPAEQDQPNLLQNAGFEEDWSLESSHRCHTFPDNNIKETGNIFTPPGWITWFRHEPGVWDQPEVTDAWVTIDARRVHSGQKGIRLFTFWRDHDGGFYQVVRGLEPGATVQFSAYGEGWSCDKENSTYTSCGDDPWRMTFQVGIEPDGNINPYAPSTVWSAPKTSYDSYSLIGPVTAQVGAEGKVVVFLRSTSKWKLKHQDAYWDDASLIVAAPGVPPTNTPPPPPVVTAGPPPTPLPTPTPRPDGSIVYVVQVGDTLYGISLKTGVPMEQIRTLNASSLSADNIIHVGQELVLSLPSETPVPTEPPPPEEVADAGDAGAGDAAAGASICVLAFHDRNGDTFRDATLEELLPNAQFTLANAAGIINQYTSDGFSEPYCFTGLAAGSYRVIQQPPPTYKASGVAEQMVAVTEGATINLEFGNVPSGEAAPSAAAEGKSEDSDNVSMRPVFSTVAKVSGVLVLLLCAGVAVLFVLNRRRMM
jgi:LysM repeat protein